MFFFSLILLLSFYFANGDVPVTSCGTGTMPDYVELDSCSATPCVVTRGQFSSLIISFTYPDEYLLPFLYIKLLTTSNMQMAIYPIPLCINNPCPVKKEQSVEYNITGPILPTTPTGTFIAQLSIIGNLQEISCSQFSFTVV